MNMIAHCRGHRELRNQAEVVRALGSDFVAEVLEAGYRQLGRAPRTAELMASWPGDPAAAALAMRFNGALHALARRGAPQALRDLYEDKHRDYDGAIGAALDAEDAFISEWMRTPPQTNEVGRAAALGAALMVARHRTGHPVELLELGSSGGLNLNLGRYAYDLGGLSAGQTDSPVRIAPVWRGSPPPYAPIDVVSARGVDLNPLDVNDAAMRERLLSFIWADQPERTRRLERALALAQCYPPRIDRGSAVTWLSERLAAPQDAGLCRVVFHSMVLQYLSSEDRAAVVDAIRHAGDRATRERPLAWIGFEWTPSRSEVHLSLTCWPTGETTHLATCHAYGDWVEWKQ